MKPEDQTALDRSLIDAQKIARRLSRCARSEAHSAALEFISRLRKLGARDRED